MTDTASHRAPITVLIVGGTGESYDGDARREPTGLLAAVAAELDERFTAQWVPYPASYGPSPKLDGECYLTSVSAGVAALRSAVERVLHDDPGAEIMMIGYSQGAVVVRTLLADPEAARVLPAITAAGFVADPHQPPGAVPGCTGWGVAGPGRPLPAGLPAFWVGAPEDVICNASPDSLVRDLADLSGTLSVRRLGLWLGDVAARVRTANLQNAALTRISPAQWRRDLQRLAVAGREVGGYLPKALSVAGRRWVNPLGGRHVSYSSEPYRAAPLTAPEETGCQALAHWLQVQATLGKRATDDGGPFQSEGATVG